jgi:hypothetical protein
VEAEIRSKGEGDMANTAEDLQSQRHLAHAYLDRLAPDQVNAVRSLLESLLSPLDRRLALTPIDDEAVTADDRTVIEAGVRSLEKNGGSSMEEVLNDLGLTLAEFEKLPESPLSCLSSIASASAHGV